MNQNSYTYSDLVFEFSRDNQMTSESQHFENCNLRLQKYHRILYCIVVHMQHEGDRTSFIKDY